MEHAPAELQERIGWQVSPSVAGLMQRLKERLDPNDILSPGRFFL